MKKKIAPDATQSWSANEKISVIASVMASFSTFEEKHL